MSKTRQVSVELLQRVFAALDGLHLHTRNNHQIHGLNWCAATAIEHLREVLGPDAQCAPVSTPSTQVQGQEAPSDVAKAVKIMAAVDEYHEYPSATTRGELRAVILDQLGTQGEGKAAAPAALEPGDDSIYRGACADGSRCLHGCHWNEPCHGSTQAQGPGAPSDAVEQADKWLLKVHAHLGDALRIPRMPWPDAGAHSHEALGRAIHASYCELRFKVIDAIAELTATRAAIAELLGTQGEGKTAAPQAEPVAKVVSSGPHDFPLLQWLSADHSFSVPIGTMLYATPQEDQRDAARYRYLRDVACVLGVPPGSLSGFDADAAIDAALRASREGA